MTQRQVLGARRCADRIGLNEAQPLDGASQSGRSEEGERDGEAPQVVEGDRHNVTASTVIATPLRA
jgi:hypothetical protein